ncbi:MAG: IS1182 family transposase [Armatimonadota bacterium]
MCLRPDQFTPVPAATARVAKAAFPKGNPYLTMRDEFGTLFHDAQFSALFPPCGQPAHAPWRLALVVILQFIEGLSDRQAADAVRRCLDWKYLLGLELDDPGFDASVLSEFRTRLIAGSAELLLFETLLDHLRARNLLKAGGRQRTDSTHVLAAARAMNRLEAVGETLRHALNVLATVAPEWLRPLCPPEWAQSYARRFDDERLPKEPAAREVLATRIGRDGYTLLLAVTAETAPAWLRELPAVETLRQVWVQNYHREPPAVGAECSVRWRTNAEIPPASGFLGTPYDPDARYGVKGTTQWEGYKVHLTETCEADAPHLITAVQTTPAPVADGDLTPVIQAELQTRDLLPDQQIVDTGYLDAGLFISSREIFGVDLVGPTRGDYRWQARAGAGFAASDFVVDWEEEYATCPQGKRSSKWNPVVDRRGTPVIKIGFATRDCGRCPCREQCTRSKVARRTVTLRTQAEYEALRAARVRETTTTFKETYALRAGVEGTLSQGLRRCGLRRCRYLGLAKTRLQHLLTATALNFYRVAQWLAEVPLAKTRRSAFSRMMTAVT